MAESQAVRATVIQGRKMMSRSVEALSSPHLVFLTLSTFYYFFLVIPRRLNFMCRRFGTLCSIFMGLVHTTFEDGTECYETSAHNIQAPGYHPKERIQHSEHGVSLNQEFSTLPHAVVLSESYSDCTINNAVSKECDFTIKHI